jgi:hypothetical protein
MRELTADSVVNAETSWVRRLRSRATMLRAAISVVEGSVVSERAIVASRV